MIRKLPFLVDFGFPHSKFVCVLALSDLPVSSEQQSPSKDLAPLEAFTRLVHQSTPEQLQNSRADSEAADPDGIIHSFEKSAVSFGQSRLPPFGLSAFLIPQESDMVDVTGEGTNEGETQHTAAVCEESEIVPPPVTAPQGPPEVEQQTLSPFSMFLNSATPPESASHTNPAGPKTQVPPELTSLPSSSFVTSSDLEALERRFQVLVSEATASINNQLCARSSAQARVPSQTTSVGSPANKASKPTPQQGSSTGRPKRNPATRRIQQRERLMAATGGAATGESAPAEEAGAAKRPKPRLQLNVQMFRKHPIFKFFVTAPVDSDNNPHKWRCRVCHVELSLKTKGSLEILSHYRTEAHLVREHRIRM